MLFNDTDIRKLEDFFEKYSRVNLINCSDYSKKSYLGSPADGCRFCGNDRLSGKFRNDSHLFPELLGNRYLLSYFECDDCNEVFKKYDDSLGKYLGFYRTLSQTKGKQIPKFKDPGTGIQAMDENGILNLIIPDQAALDNSLESKEMILRVNNQPHIPLNTYKALTKMAVSMLEANEINLPNKICDFLLNKIRVVNIASTEIFKVCMDFMPAPMFVKDPIGILYKRIKQNEYIPGYIFQLLYKQISLQIFIPFHKIDEHIYAEKHVGTIPFAPVVVPLEIQEKFGPSLRKIENLNSEDKSVYNEMTVTMKFDSIQKHKKNS